MSETRAQYGEAEPIKGLSVNQKIEAALELVSALCKPRGTPGAREWVMSIPARPDYDPDIVISDALRAASDEIARLRKALEKIQQMRPDFVMNRRARVGDPNAFGYNYEMVARAALNHAAPAAEQEGE